MTNIVGTYGKATRIPLPQSTRAEQTLVMWLLDAPQAHPFWTQYLLSVVMLDDHPDFPPANKHFPEATHELFVFALNPDYGPHDEETLKPFMEKGSLPILQPINVVQQFKATGEQMKKLVRCAVQDVVDGKLSPEAPFSTESNNKYWGAVLNKYLANPFLMESDETKNDTPDWKGRGA